MRHMLKEKQRREQLKEAVEVAEDVQIEQRQVGDAESPEEGKKSESRPHTVSRERIERLKRAFRPTWLHEMINGPDKTTNSKKDK